MSVAIYTCITGKYDSLKNHVGIHGVDWICYTDDPDLQLPGWEIVDLEPSDAPPRLKAKYPKLLAPQGDLDGYDYTIWIDGSTEVISPTFVDEALADLGPDGFALFSHPWRDCIYDEVKASRTVAFKYDHQPLEEQAEHYRSLGHPEHWGLWACGSMARARSGRLDAAMRDWMAEIERWSIQDQISLPFVMRTRDIRPQAWPYGQYRTPWLRFHQHVDST